MHIKYVVVLYAFIILYAALTFLLGELVPIITIVLGFGMLIIPYLILEWVVTPMIAAVMGFQARWSLIAAIIFGIPLMFLYTIATPVVSSGNSSLPVPVPWLSVYKTMKHSILPIITERLIWWSGIYLFAAFIGKISCRWSPPKLPD
ncbi:hypothetical protein ACUHMQ_02965 [Chitinimonas sp. PSY-7]|uniref:hypothetical protein n=1 Tax=Chitinimonas sp. PSY-7 TaxID=3459088 RepID=UPI00404003A5